MSIYKPGGDRRQGSETGGCSTRQEKRKGKEKNKIVGKVDHEMTLLKFQKKKSTELKYQKQKSKRFKKHKYMSFICRVIR